MPNRSLTSLVVAALASLVGCSEGFDPEPMIDSAWNYETVTGPHHWSEMSPDYALCNTGRQQSPLDLAEGAVIENDSQAISHRYTVAGTQLVHNEHTLQLNFPAGNVVRFARTDYRLAQFHLHAPSEHLIDGVPAAMEVHLVHQSRDGKILVIGVLLRTGRASAWLGRVLASAPTRGKTITLPTGINASELLPSDVEEGGIYSYTGSLTTPPCTEDVSWFVMEDAGFVSAAQVAEFLRLNGNNARPIQPRNGRLIDEYSLEF